MGLFGGKTYPRKSGKAIFLVVGKNPKISIDGKIR